MTCDVWLKFAGPSRGERDIGPGQIGGVCPCGSSSIKVAGTCLLVLVFSFWLLFSGVWETLIFGTGDWLAFGEPFFCGLFTPTYPLPGHRLVPESHVMFIVIVLVALW